MAKLSLSAQLWYDPPIDTITGVLDLTLRSGGVIRETSLNLAWVKRRTSNNAITFFDANSRPLATIAEPDANRYANGGDTYSLIFSLLWNGTNGPLAKITDEAQQSNIRGPRSEGEPQSPQITRRDYAELTLRKEEECIFLPLFPSA